MWHVLGWRESIHANNTLFSIYFIMLSSLSIIPWNSFANLIIVSEWFSALSWREQANFNWDDDEVRFVLYQHS
jgi:hypothetical protein